jgi:hypothetical protein
MMEKWHKNKKNYTDGRLLGFSGGGTEKEN